MVLIDFKRNVDISTDIGELKEKPATKQNVEDTLYTCVLS